jgi:hypothetical protein
MSQSGAGTATVDAVLGWCREVLDRFGTAARIGGSSSSWRREGDDAFRLAADVDGDDTLALFGLAKELETSHQYQRAEDAIRSDDGFGPHLGKLVGDAQIGTGLYPDQLLFSTVVAAAREPSDARVAIQARLDQVRAFLAGSTRPRRVVAPLPSGFRTETRDRVDLGDRTSLIRLDDTDIATALDLGLRFRDEAEAFGFATVGTPWAIEVRFEVAAVSRRPEDEVPKELLVAAADGANDANAQVRRVVQAMRLTKPGLVSVLGVLHISEEPLLGGRTVAYSSTRLPRPLSDSYDFEMSDVATLRRLLRQLRNDGVTASPALETAIRRFSASSEHHDAQDRLLDLIISAEALFGNDAQPGDTTLRVAQRFARFVAPVAKRSVMDLFGHMKQQYRGRSGIVHANRRRAKVQRKIDRAIQETDETERLMRLALRRALNETVDRGGFQVDWDRLVLGRD